MPHAALDGFRFTPFRSRAYSFTVPLSPQKATCRQDVPTLWRFSTLAFLAHSIDANVMKPFGDVFSFPKRWIPAIVPNVSKYAMSSFSEVDGRRPSKEILPGKSTSLWRGERLSERALYDKMGKYGNVENKSGLLLS